MRRTKLRDRIMPRYTKGEEIFNMVSHIVGGAFGILALVACLIKSILYGDAWSVVSSAVYGISMIVLYTMSGIYHGLHDGMGKRVMQVLDHCTIYFLICGSYTPVLLCSIRKTAPVWAWSLFGAIWAMAAAAIVFTAIDLKKYRVLSMACYIGMGWCIVFAIKPLIRAVPMAGIWWLVAGGIAYTVGAVLYGAGKKIKYMHSVFHLFVVLGSILQFVCIFKYVI